MARIVRRKVPGQPGAKNWNMPALRTFRNPILKKQGVRTLIKRNEADGKSLPSFSKITDAKGVDAGGGFVTRASTKLQRPFVKPGIRTRPGRIIKPAKLAKGGIKNRKNGV